MKMVQVKKYGDLIPVQLREDWESHLDQLAQAHGESSIILEDGRTLRELRQPERDRQEQEAAEAAEADRLRIEAEEAAQNPPQSDEGGAEGGEPSGEGGESSAPTDEPAAPAKKTPAKKSASKKSKGAA